MIDRLNMTAFLVDTPVITGTDGGDNLSGSLLIVAFLAGSVQPAIAGRGVSRLRLL
jgi:hypothetical protein